MPRPRIHPNLQAGGDTGETLYKVGSARRPTAEPDNFTGEVGDLFYSMRDTKLRISDGYTVGGWYIIPDFEGVDTDILPTINNYFNIGAPDNYFQNIYGGNVTIFGDLTVEGDTITNNNIENHTIILNVGGNDPDDSDQGGIKIFIEENNYASILYDYSSDTFVINKNIQTNLLGDIYSENNIQVFENGATGNDAWFKGYVYGQVNDISNHSLNDLLDVEAYPGDGQVLAWNDANQLWEAVTVSGGGGGGGSVNEAFTTIQVSGQTDVTADSSTDTLTLVAGNNISITTDPTTDAITISAPFTNFDGLFGAKSINNLSDVDILTDYTITEGQTLVWDDTAGEFIPGDRVTQDIFNTFFIDASIGDLTDIDITNINEGDTLVWDPTINQFITVGHVDKLLDLLDVDGTGIADGQVMQYDSSQNKFVPADPTTATDVTNIINATSLDELSDVNTSTTTPSDGQILIWNGTNQEWEPGDLSAGGGGSTTLSGLTDTDTSGLQDGDALVYDSSTGDWKPVPVVTNGISYSYDPNTGKYVGDTLIFDGESVPIRSIDYDNEEIIINPAAFTPTVTATGQSLLWDQPATQFTVDVQNPADYPSQYIASVDSITNATGVHSTVSDYTTTGPTTTPAGGVDWDQTFTTNSNAVITSDGTGTTGGSATAEVTFADDTSTPYTDTENIYYNWGNVDSSIIATIPSGQNFLGSYSTVNYTVNTTGLSDPNNAVTTLTPTNGTISNASGSGVFTPSSALIPGSYNNGTIDLSTEFTRPASVTGTGYTTTVTDSVTIPAGNFSYPSFNVWTSSKYVTPVLSDIVDGNDFHADVTELGDEASTIDTYINNSSSVPRAYWFAVRSSATQPTTFKTGYDPSLLSDVDVETGNTIDLEPTTPPTGYVAEEYTLYGITLQPGNTYVRIN